MNIIEIKDLKKDYNTSQIPVKALKNISLNFSKGEFSAIVGPSGSGKTTLLNIIGGLDNPTSGNIIINNNDIFKMKENELINYRLSNIGFVFQSYNLIPVFSAFENIEFNMQLLKIPKKNRKGRVMQLLNDLGLEEKADRRPSHLSGGEQQRVAVAKALASRPQFILADEPTANLDTESAERLLELMLKMCEKEKTTFIFSTHDQRVIEKAKRVIVLKDGVIESDELKN